MHDQTSVGVQLFFSLTGLYVAAVWQKHLTEMSKKSIYVFAVRA